MLKSVLFIMIFVCLSFAASDSLPNLSLTPGDTLPGADTCVCHKGYAQTVRHVPGSLKHKIYVEYGITSHKSGDYEIDHLISLELGGSNSAKNLWPQSYVTTPWNAHLKDALENRLHALVCSGKMTLHDAQYAISHDWISAYKKYVVKPRG